MESHGITQLNRYDQISSVHSDVHQPSSDAHIQSAPDYHPMSQTTTPSGMRPPPVQIDTQGITIARSRQSPASSAFNSAQPSPLQQAIPLPNTPGTPQAMSPHYAGANDPNMYNFDVSSMNFGNHYGALEMGMLDQITSNAQSDALNAGSTTARYAVPQYGPSQFSEHQMSQNFAVTSGNPSAWATTPSHPVTIPPSYPRTHDDPYRMTGHGLPQAFAIETGHRMSSTSPSSSTDFIPPENAIDPSRSPLRHHHAAFKSNDASLLSQQRQPPRMSGRSSFNTSRHTESSTGAMRAAEAQQQEQKGPRTGNSYERHGRKRDPAEIYRRVINPYPYTEAFHKLFAFIKRRFSPEKRNKIAKALASVRPSFISTTNTLVRDDLVFMERIFQRSLLEYEFFTTQCGTPTLVCRRTGEVALSTQAFTSFSGWTKNVLLGRESNLNTNGKPLRTEGSTTTSALPTVGSRSGMNTPVNPRTPAEPGSGPKSVEQQAQGIRKQPIFLAELIDDDSAVRFYEDYAQLAFADTKGSAWSPCKVLKYRSSDVDAEGLRGDEQVKQEESGGVKREADMRSLGSEEMVPCMYCWMVKRDVFNIPMVIVINVSGLDSRCTP